MAKYKYAVNLMLEFEGEKPPFKKDVKNKVEWQVGGYWAEDDFKLLKARVRSVDLD